MPSIPAILEFELVPGANVDAVIAAKALIAWSEAIKEAAKIADPMGGFSIGLVSAEPACIRFSTILHFIEEKLFGSVSDALDPYPKIKHFLALNVLILPSIVGGGSLLEWMKEPDTKAEEVQQQVANSPAVQKHVQTFYKEIQSDPSVSRVIVRESIEGPAVMSVDRSEFAERSGMWAIESDDIEQNDRPGGGIWNVVVTHPVSIAKPLAWGFMRDGLPFKAKMTDPRFIAAIKSGTLPIPIQEGVNMKIRVTWTERLEGQLWKSVPGTYRVEEVLSPEI